MLACPCGNGFQALAQLVDFDGQLGERQRFSTTATVLVDQSA